MSACAMLSYNNVTQEAWRCGIAKAATYGVTITRDQGSATVSGFTLAWNYNPGAQSLQLQCTDSPWWAPSSTVNAHINNAVEACLSQHQVTLTHMVA
jgi:hypothetical protein